MSATRRVLDLMPPPFSAGLNLWSREDGVPDLGRSAPAVRGRCRERGA